MSMLHGDWQPVTLGWAHRLNVIEGWFSYELLAWVCQNRNDGRWYYSLNDEGPDMKAPCNTKQWAMLLAQEERARRPERKGFEMFDAVHAALLAYKAAVDAQIVLVAKLRDVATGGSR